METNPDRVRARLQKVRNAMVSTRIALGVLFWAGVLMTLWLILFTLDNLLDLPGELRFPLGLGALIASIYGLVRHVALPAARKQTLEDTALILEDRYGVKRNRLINAFQLERRTGEMSEREAAYAYGGVDEGDKRLKRVPIGELTQRKKLVAWTLGATVMIGIWIFYAAAAPEALANAAKRYGLPLSDIPPVGKVNLIVDPKDDLSIPEDDTLEIICVVEPRAEGEEAEALLKESPHIVLVTGKEPVSSSFDSTRAVTMARKSKEELLDTFASRTGHQPTPEDLEKYGTEQENLAYKSDGAIFVHTLPSIKRPIAFRIFHREGGTYSTGIEIGVIRAPKITGSTFTVTPPAYTGLGGVDSLGPPQDVAGLAGSNIEVEVELDRAVEQLAWSAGDSGLIPFKQDKETPNVWRVNAPLTQAAPYSVMVTRDNMRRPAAAATGQILMREDRPPQVDFTNASRNVVMMSGERLRIGVTGFDDYGLASMELTYRSALGGTPPELIKEWNFGGAPGQIDPFTQTYTITLDASKFTPGYEYIFEVTARDHHPDEQETVSRPFLLRIQEIGSGPPPAVPAQSARLFNLLDEAIARQQESLNNVRNVSNYLVEALGFDPEKPEFTFHEHHSRIAETQDAVRNALNELAASAGSEPPALIDEIRELNNNNVVDLLKQISSLDKPDHWLGEFNPIDTGNLFKEDDKGAVRFPSSRGRYIGLVANTTHGDKGQAAIAELAPLDSEGGRFPGRFIQSWHVLKKPIPIENPDLFPDLETGQLQSMFAELRSTELHWSSTDKIDFMAIYEGGETTNRVTYAAREIHCAQAQQARLLVSMDDNVRVWINEELVMEERGYQDRPDRLRADVDLVAGSNRILVEVLNAEGGWEFYLRFTTPEGDPLAVWNDHSLAPIPVFRAAAFNGKEGEKVVDRRADSWTATELPGMIMIDLGREFNLGGLYIEATRDQNLRVKDFDVYLTNGFGAATNLPPLLSDISRKQSFVLDQLVRIRGKEIKDAEQAPDPVEPREDPTEEKEAPDLVLKEKVEEFLEDVIQFRNEAAELNQRRESILDEGNFTRQNLEALKDIKDAENRIAKAIEQAVADLPEPESIPEEEIEPDVLEAMDAIFEKAEDLIQLANQNAEADPEESTGDLGDAIAETADELVGSAGAITPEAAMAQEDRENPVDTSEIPLALEDQVSEVDEEQNEFRDIIREVAADLEAGVEPGTEAGNPDPAPESPGEFEPAGDASPGTVQNAYNRQKTIRETAEALARELETHSLPVAEFKAAIEQMKEVEQAILDRDASKIRQAYTAAADLTGSARENVARAQGLQYLKNRLETKKLSGPVDRGRNAPPKGFETMVGKYFERLAESE